MWLSFCANIEHPDTFIMISCFVYYSFRSKKSCPDKRAAFIITGKQIGFWRHLFIRKMVRIYGPTNLIPTSLKKLTYFSYVKEGILGVNFRISLNNSSILTLRCYKKDRSGFS